MELLIADIYDIVPSKENFYNTEDIEDLKNSINLLGILQPLLVQPNGDKYDLKAGHRRLLACISLVEEDNKEKFRYVPCVIKKTEEETERETDIEQKSKEIIIIDRLKLIMANSFRDKSDWEKMEEALQQEALIEELRKNVKMQGRTRSILKEFTGGKIKETQIGRYAAIKKNLCAELMEEFKENNIGISTAYETSGLSKEYQKQAHELFMENGILTVGDIKRLKKLEEAERQIPGQIEWRGQQEETNQEKSMEDLHQTKDNNELELENGFNPVPESVISICYSCKHYAECNVKTSTAKQCETYLNKAEAEKTAKQQYSEEQDKIDKETRKKIKEVQQTEKMQQPITHTRDTIHKIRLPVSRKDAIKNRIQTFILTKTDNYKEGDILEMQEYSKGIETGGILKAEIICIEEYCTGLADGFCILGIKI